MTNCFPFPHLISPSLPLSTLSVSLAGVANRPRPQFPLQLRLPPLGVFKLAHWWAKRKVFVVMQSRFDFDWDSFSDFLWRPGKGEENEEIGGRWGEINTYLSLTGQLTRLAGDSHSTHSYKWIVPGTRCESVVRWGVTGVLGGYLMEGTAWHLRGTFWGSTAEYSNARNYPGHATRPSRDSHSLSNYEVGKQEKENFYYQKLQCAMQAKGARRRLTVNCRFKSRGCTGGGGSLCGVNSSFVLGLSVCVCVYRDPSSNKHPA